jgi:hypothetical protein
MAPSRKMRPYALWRPINSSVFRVTTLSLNLRKKFTYLYLYFNRFLLHRYLCRSILLKGKNIPFYVKFVSVTLSLIKTMRLRVAKHVPYQRREVEVPRCLAWRSTNIVQKSRCVRPTVVSNRNLQSIFIFYRYKIHANHCGFCLGSMIMTILLLCC